MRGGARREPTPGHVPGLDGLRGLAVLGVLLFHDGGALRGGYLGVDLFFVLSGFLITRLLLAEHAATGRIDLPAFWERRARRLLPALLALLFGVALYAATIAPAEGVAKIRGDALATLAYVANWRAIVTHQSYWAMFALPSPLEHAWSLSIEEQFYVAWPLVVALLLARAGRTGGAGRKRVTLVAGVLALASGVAMALLFDRSGTTRAYLGTDTRGAAILAGAALAASGLAEEARGATVAWEGLGLVAAAGLAWAWARLDGRSDALYRGGFGATELAALVLIALCVRRPRGLVSRALSAPPLRAIGTISYGVYLFHWPIYVLLTPERTAVSGPGLLAIRLGVTLAVALWSYVALERPIRAHGLRWGRPIVVAPAATALALLAVLAGTRARPGSPPSIEPPPASAALPPPRALAPSPARRAVTRAIAGDLLPSREEVAPGVLRVLVLGDSVGLSLGARMRWAQTETGAWAAVRAFGDCSIMDGVVPVRTLSGTPPDNGDCAQRWVSDVQELRPGVTAILIGGAFFSTYRIDGRWRGVCDPRWQAAYARRLSELVRAIAPFTDRTAIVLSPIPVGRFRTAGVDEKVACYDAALRDAAAAAGAEAIDLNAFVCPDRACTQTSRGAPVRPDGLHFDGLGAQDTARWMLQALGAGRDAGAAVAPSAPDPL